VKVWSKKPGNRRGRKERERKRKEEGKSKGKKLVQKNHQAKIQIPLNRRLPQKTTQKRQSPVIPKKAKTSQPKK